MFQDKWNASIALVVSEQVEDLENINVFAQTVNSGVRRLFSIITAEELFNLVFNALYIYIMYNISFYRFDLIFNSNFFNLSHAIISTVAFPPLL